MTLVGMCKGRSPEESGPVGMEGSSALEVPLEAQLQKNAME